MVSLLNLDIAGTIKAYTIDFLMKLIYYLYATLAAGVDAMQSLVRMLCGLENYAMSAMIPIYDDKGNIIDYATSTATSGDPLSNFILGVLGIGENSEVYSALNTVFWSLAVFALIILAITTMVAMVKAHYNEDSQQTNPWTYIYTAGKAIFTFAFIPIVTIIGFQLASFILQTLDNITAGVGNSSDVIELYGTSATNVLKSSTDEDGKVTYANYDMFGNLKPTSTSTFSGMLFNASMYGANRLRNNQVTLSQVQSTFVTRDGGLFGQEDCSAFGSLTNEGDKILYVANQIDYAFANSLALKNPYSWDALKGTFEDSFIIGKLDPFKPNSINGFYKFHASVIWAYYDLMQFNFIVGFAGVFTTFGIMLSIVLALVSRLIKGVALFLVYPTLLGIAPMDNFKAFKSWATNFMQQIMMAFGSIVGINLLLLILPYVQNFKFFDYEILNYMMNVIMLVVGLVMAKDFMSMISGFVGGADANQVGEGMKGEVGNKIKSGIKPAAAVAGGYLRTNAALLATGYKVAKRVRARSSADRANRKAQKAQRKLAQVDNSTVDTSALDQASSNLANARSNAISANDNYSKATSDLEAAKQNKDTIYKNLINSGKQSAKELIYNPKNDTEKEIVKNAKDALAAEGINANDKEALRFKVAEEMFKRGIDKRGGKNGGKSVFDKNLKNQYNDISNDVIAKEQAVNSAKAARDKANSEEKNAENVYTTESQKVANAKDNSDRNARLIEKANKAQAKADKIAAKYGLVQDETTGEYQFKDGKKPGLFSSGDKGIFKQVGEKIKEGIDGMSLGRTIADSFVKTIEGVGSGLGLDKVIKAATDEMGKSLTFKGGPFKPSVAGDALQKKQHAEIMKQDKEQTTALNDIRKAIEELRKDTNKNAQEAKNNPKP